MAFIFFPLLIFPMTWVWMLAYGGLGFGYSYWEALPLGTGSVVLLGLFIALASIDHKTVSELEVEQITRPQRRWPQGESHADPVRL